MSALPLADPGVASDHARRAGDEASRSLSFAEAAGWYERALQAWAATDRPANATGEIELALGRAYEADHQFSRAGPRM